jgi:hypothetical protein
VASREVELQFGFVEHFLVRGSPGLDSDRCDDERT